MCDIITGDELTIKGYIENNLNAMLIEIIRQRLSSGLANVKLYHNNLIHHVARIVISFINNNKVHIIDHPPYSSNLAPSDFRLFDFKIKLE